MKLKGYYWLTVGLNTMFVLLVPLLITAALGHTKIMFLSYLFIYSFAETYIDRAWIAGTPKSLFIVEYGITVLYNLLMLVLVSFVIKQLLFVFGVVPTLLAMFSIILVMSKIEVLIDQKIGRT